MGNAGVNPLGRSRARRAMELGRARTALVSASIVTVVLAGIAVALHEGEGVHLLALPFLAWTFVSFRGGALARGGLAGLLGAVAGWVVPMSILRPCCSNGAMAAMTAGADCCTRPECCLETGAMLGVLVAMVVSLMPARSARVLTPEGPDGSAPGARTGGAGAGEPIVQMLGAILVGAATLGVRCSGLFLGESLGLVGGLALGAAIAGGARMLMLRPTAA
jgi:hypothetical protein